jgi:hypothetical protein
MVVDEVLTVGRFLKYRQGRYHVLSRRDAVRKVYDLIGFMRQLKQRASSIRTNPAKQVNDRCKAASSACHAATVLSSKESRSKKRQRPHDSTFGDRSHQSPVSPESSAACKSYKDIAPGVPQQEAMEGLASFTQASKVSHGKGRRDQNEDTRTCSSSEGSMLRSGHPRNDANVEKRRVHTSIGINRSSVFDQLLNEAADLVLGPSY